LPSMHEALGLSPARKREREREREREDGVGGGKKGKKEKAKSNFIVFWYFKLYSLLS
jgi:hypothetical protein